MFVRRAAAQLKITFILHVLINPIIHVKFDMRVLILESINNTLGHLNRKVKVGVRVEAI